MKWTLVVALLAPLGQSTASAVSHVYDVTSENIDKHPLQIRISSEAYSNDTVGFRVFVTARQGDLSPLREGRFEVANEDLVRRDSALQPSPRPVLWCNVQENNKDGMLLYSFGLPRDTLSRASFTFRSYERTGMPAFDGYRVLLGEFAPKK